MAESSVERRAAGAEAMPAPENPQEARLYREFVADSEAQGLRYVDISGRAYRRVKRGMDIVLALLGAAVLLLPILLVLLAVIIDDPGKPMFQQWRIGMNGKRFRIYKIRSMRINTPKYLPTGDVDRPEQYITRVGKFLRKTSLDEMPQLLNVIRGDMSLIGPRPLIPGERGIHLMRQYLGVYQLRPGITGLAQINGRDNVSPREKVYWDARYLKNFGFGSDLKILLYTVKQVISGEGVVEGRAGGHRDQKKDSDK